MTRPSSGLSSLARPLYRGTQLGQPAVEVRLDAFQGSGELRREARVEAFQQRAEGACLTCSVHPTGIRHELVDTAAFGGQRRQQRLQAHPAIAAQASAEVGGTGTHRLTHRGRRRQLPDNAVALLRVQQQVGASRGRDRLAVGALAVAVAVPVLGNGWCGGHQGERDRAGSDAEAEDARHGVSPFEATGASGRLG